MHSFWEYQEWFKEVDFAIVGSGIVGLQCGLSLRRKHPKAKIIILERGYLPSGASSKNAGFACFGSPSEILDDLRSSSPEEVAELVELRTRGLEILKNTCGVNEIDFEQLGSHEVFTNSEEELFHSCAEKLEDLNTLLQPIFNQRIFEISDHRISTFGFRNVTHLIENKLEGQINTGKMIQRLIQLARQANIEIINGAEVTNLDDWGQSVTIELNTNYNFESKKVLIANNGFAAKLLPDLDVKPARAQVLVTSPISDLRLKGTFHMLEGFYYFRNVGDRVLFGGGRNLDFLGETTTELSLSELIQKDLEKKLIEIILPDINFTVEHRWAGVMGVGHTKKPIVQAVSSNIICGVRMGGMGVAIGSIIGDQMANHM
ncbi:MAG: FAD-binding oxidoreductase [Flavobacteriales bacterium]|nr:FAD-binding oxidoreductase [Flavobacteriales bacterium]